DGRSDPEGESVDARRRDHPPRDVRAEPCLEPIVRRHVALGRAGPIEETECHSTPEVRRPRNDWSAHRTWPMPSSRGREGTKALVRWRSAPDWNAGPRANVTHGGASVAPPVASRSVERGPSCCSRCSVELRPRAHQPVAPTSQSRPPTARALTDRDEATTQP